MMLIFFKCRRPGGGVVWKFGYMRTRGERKNGQKFVDVLFGWPLIANPDLLRLFHSPQTLARFHKRSWIIKPFTILKWSNIIWCLLLTTIKRASPFTKIRSRRPKSTKNTTNKRPKDDQKYGQKSTKIKKTTKRWPKFDQRLKDDRKTINI